MKTKHSIFFKRKKVKNSAFKRYVTTFNSMCAMFNETKLQRHFVSSRLLFSISELPKYSYFLRILANFGFGLNSS